MKSRLRIFLIVTSLAGVLGLFSSCATTPETTPTPPLLLISMDAFRWDYCAKYPNETPNLRQLMKEGSSLKSLIPVYPSNTFPNHYSIVTGLYPAHHGIINNEVFDPTTQKVFRYNRPASVHESEWWGGEPIWVTSIKQGHPAATWYWVGSEARIKDVYPTFWKAYDYSVPFEKRLDDMMTSLQLPDDERPLVTCFYLEETNSAGHKFGPDSPQVAAAVKLLDTRLGAIRERLKAARLAVNIVIVSDHGMTPISPERVVLLDDYLDLSSVQLDFYGPQAGLRPLEGSPESIVRALSALPHATVYLSKDLPARFHLKDNPRIPSVWVAADEGWELDTRKHFEAIRGKFNHGDHGFDPAFTSMQGILIAAGPSFKTGVVGDSVENIHIYNLLCAALRLKPAPNDGDDRLVRAFLRP